MDSQTEGIFAVYKPKGPTSYDVVHLIKKATGKKVGHGGTLDPLARGVLVVGVGRQATKKLFEVVQKEKEYLAKIKLGFNSATDDGEGPISKVVVTTKPTLDQIKNVLKKFVGQIEQKPPVFSAIKIQGKKAYQLARRGGNPELKPRVVEVKDIKLLGYKWPYLKLKIVSGPGFYVRSLARDLGEKLKTGGYLADLERTRVGDFKAQNAILIKDKK